MSTQLKKFLRELNNMSGSVSNRVKEMQAKLSVNGPTNQPLTTNKNTPRSSESKSEVVTKVSKTTIEKSAPVLLPRMSKPVVEPSKAIEKPEIKPSTPLPIRSSNNEILARKTEPKLPPPPRTIQTPPPKLLEKAIVGTPPAPQKLTESKAVIKTPPPPSAQPKQETNKEEKGPSFGSGRLISPPKLRLIHNPETVELKEKVAPVAKINRPLPPSPPKRKYY
jgi:hypothetical protein